MILPDVHEALPARSASQFVEDPLGYDGLHADAVQAVFRPVVDALEDWIGEPARHLREGFGGTYPAGSTPASIEDAAYEAIVPACELAFGDSESLSWATAHVGRMLTLHIMQSGIRADAEGTQERGDSATKEKR